VSGDEGDALANELVGYRHGLRRITRIIPDDKLDLLAENAAGRVQVAVATKTSACADICPIAISATATIRLIARFPMVSRSAG
jgi:hypothetical protein